MSEILRRALRWTPQEGADDGKGAGGGEGDKGVGADADLGTIEERAARMGWKPKDQFKGDASKWSSAADYVRLGEESLPVLRERLRNLEQTNAQLGKSVQEVRAMNDKVYERALTQARKEAKDEIDRAVKAGDTGAAHAASERLAETERADAERKAAGASDPVFDGWVAQNNWYKDPQLNTEAQVEAFRLRKNGEKSEGAEFLDKVAAAVKARFPDKFKNPRREGAGNDVERPGGGGEGGGGGRGGKKSWDNMPASAKTAGQRYINQKLYKDKAAYAEAYWAQDAGSEG